MFLLLGFPEFWVIHFLFQEVNTYRNHTSFFFPVYVEYWDVTCLPCYSRSTDTAPGRDFWWGHCLKQGVPSLNFPPTLSSVEIFSFFFLDIRPSYQLGKYMWPVTWTDSLNLSLYWFKTDLKLFLSHHFFKLSEVHTQNPILSS